MGNKKQKNMIIRIDEKLLNDYQELCNKQGLNMSKAIRNYINRQVDNMSYRINTLIELESELKNYVNNTIKEGYTTPFVYGGLEEHFPPFMYNINLIDEKGSKIVGYFSGEDEYSLGIHQIGIKNNIHIRYPRK